MLLHAVNKILVFFALKESSVNTSAKKHIDHKELLPCSDKFSWEAVISSTREPILHSFEEKIKAVKHHIK